MTLSPAPAQLAPLSGLPPPSGESAHASRGYLVALLAVAVAALLRALLIPLLGPSELRFITFFAAIVIAGTVGGLRAAFLALGASAVLATLFFAQVPGGLLPATGNDWAAFLTCLAFGGLSAYFGGSLRQARLGADASAQLAIAHAREAAAESVRASERLAALDREMDLRATAERATARLHRHLAQSPLGVVEFDHALRLTRWEGRAEAIFGYAAAEVVGHTLPELGIVHPDDRASVSASQATLLGNGHDVVVLHTRNLHKHGHTLHCEWYSSVLHDERGAVTSVLSLVVDTTDHRRREAERERLLGELARERARLRAVVESTPVALALHEVPGGAVTLQNREMTRLSRLITGTENGLGNLADHGARRLDGVPYAAADLPEARALRLGIPVRDERLICTAVATGEAVVLSCSSIPLRDPDGGLVGVVASAVDVTAEQRKLSALERSEFRFRSLVEDSPAFLWATDAFGHPVFVNRAFERYTGATLADLERQGWHRFHHPQEADRHAAAWAVATASLLPFEALCRIRRHDGAYGRFFCRAAPALDSQGLVTGWVGMALEIREVRPRDPDEGIEPAARGA